MPRKPQVTRTLTVTEADVLCLDLMLQKPFHKTVLLAGSFPSEPALMKRIRQAVDSTVTKAVNCTKSKTYQRIYSMSEQEFLDRAKPIENRK